MVCLKIMEIVFGERIPLTNINIHAFHFLSLMKKFLAPVLGVLAAVSLFHFEPAMAQLIDMGDNPQNVSDATAGETSFRRIAKTIVNFFLFFLGLVATVMVIFGGFLYVTSGGNDQNTEKAKKIILYSAIGILLILISFALVNTLLGAATGVAPTV